MLCRSCLNIKGVKAAQLVCDVSDLSETIEDFSCWNWRSTKRHVRPVQELKCGLSISEISRSRSISISIFVWIPISIPISIFIKDQDQYSNILILILKNQYF